MDFSDHHSEAPHRRAGPRALQEQSILCRNRCGFYGNPKWDGYCSVCYRNQHPPSVPPPLHQENSASSSSLSSLNLPSNMNSQLASVVLPSFRKFEEKRKQISGKGANTVKSIFGIGKDADGLGSTQEFDAESTQAAEQFSSYLSRLRKPTAVDLTKQVNSIVESVESALGQTKDMESCSMLVHKFYDDLQQRLNSHPNYKGLTEQQRDSIMEHVERFLCTRLYPILFSSHLTDDENRDIILQQRIRSLHWVTPQMIEAMVSLNPSGAELTHMETGMRALLEMNGMKAPQDKLGCVVSASRAVIHQLTARQQALKAASGSQNNTGSNFTASADDFLPALIWLVLKANPPLLQSNLQFIARFANPRRINTGQTGYYFTNLNCAVQFIENVTAESLSLSEKEFEQFMRGEAKPNVSQWPYSLPGNDLVGGRDLLDGSGAGGEPVCEGVLIILENETKLSQLMSRQEQLKKKVEHFEDEIGKFFDEMFTSCDELQQSCPLPNNVGGEGNLVDLKTSGSGPTPTTVGSVLDSPLDQEDSLLLLPEPLKPLEVVTPSVGASSLPRL